MSRIGRRRVLLRWLLLAAALPAVALSAKPLAKPAEIRVLVSPAEVAPGGRARVTLRLEPIEGVQINRYPKIKLTVPARAGLVGAGEASIGNSAPPPPDDKEANYYDRVDPVELELELDTSAASGQHRIPGELLYYYCVKSSGFCAPARVPVEIPLRVR